MKKKAIQAAARSAVRVRSLPCNGFELSMGTTVMLSAKQCVPPAPDHDDPWDAYFPLSARLSAALGDPPATHFLVAMHNERYDKVMHRVPRPVAYFPLSMAIEMVRVVKELVASWLFVHHVYDRPHGMSDAHHGAAIGLCRSGLIGIVEQSRTHLSQWLEVYLYATESKPIGLALRGVAGERCVVNGRGDLAMNAETRSFIGKQCEIVRLQKNGHYRVLLCADPLQTYAFAKRNLDPFYDHSGAPLHPPLPAPSPSSPTS